MRGAGLALQGNLADWIEAKKKEGGFSGAVLLHSLILNQIAVYSYMYSILSLAGVFAPCVVARMFPP